MHSSFTDDVNEKTVAAPMALPPVLTVTPLCLSISPFLPALLMSSFDVTKGISKGCCLHRVG